MKKNEVKVGQCYIAKVSDKLVTVRIDSAHSRAGWNATNTATGKRIHVKSAQRLRGLVEEAEKVDASEAVEIAADAPVTQTAHDNAAAGKSKKAAGEVGNAEATIKSKAKATTATKRDGKPKREAKPKGEPKPKRVSALDAAAQVLKAAGKPMRAQDLIAAMAEQGLWKSPGGKTPHATLYAAMIREIATKDKDARFIKTDRGLFASSKAGA